MPLDRFQLLELKRDEGARTFEAREIATGRPVLVHLFGEKPSPLSRALLAKLDALSDQERDRVIERGDSGGGIYLVTDRLVDYAGLREWLTAIKPDVQKPLNIAGAWQVPRPTPKTNVDDQLASLFDTVQQPVPEAVPGIGGLPDGPVLTDTGVQTLKMPSPPAQPAVPASAPVIPPVGDAPGAFTRMFAQAPAVPSAKKEPPPPPDPTSTADEPGEFTRQFAPVLRPAPPPVKKDPPARPAPAAPPNEPGEFTRQFAPVLRPVPPAAAPPQPNEVAAPPPVQKPAAQPGEFTRLFQRITPPAAAAPPPAQPPPADESRPPGEFTQMLQAQRPVAPAPPAPPSQSGEFARFFQSPLAPSSQPASPVYAPPTPPQPPRGAGEFTQVFGRGDIPLPPPPPAPAAPPPPASANATQAFAAHRLPPPPVTPAAPVFALTPPTIPQPSSQVAGEYTRMFSAPAPLTFGQPQAAPQVARVPESRPPVRNKSRLPLLLMIGAAVLLIAAVILYFVMRPHSA